jgi:hypothetical protein
VSEPDEIIITIRIRGRSDDDEDEGGIGNGGDGSGQGPTATPMLLVPFAPGDIGRRPLTPGQAFASGGILAAIANPSDPNGWANFAIQISCMVENLGAVASAVCLAEFYVGDQFGIWNPPHKSVSPAQVKANAELIGRASFTAPQGKVTVLECPNLWKPGSSAGAEKGVLVQVYDLFSDPMTAPFDAMNDRHVARNDGVMNPLLNAVTVSGALIPKLKTDESPTYVTFADVATGKKYIADVVGDNYSILLPNPATYDVTVTFVIVGGSTLCRRGPQTPEG